VFVKDIVFHKKYVNELATENNLKKSDIEFIYSKFGKLSDEKIVYVTATKGTLEESGVVLTNKRLISYLGGLDNASMDSVHLDSIKIVQMNKSESILKTSLIRVTKQDSTTFSFGVGSTNHTDEILFDKIKSLSHIKPNPCAESKRI
jgi:hypothetical protein